MKIAIGIIGIMLGILVLLQSCTVGTASHLVGDAATGDAGSLGILAGLLLFVGGAFAFGLPIVSTVTFTLAGLIAFAGSAQFPDLKVWGFIALAMAVMAFFTWRSAKKKKAVI
jgi:ABC-type cobalamin transport system ATPase subunit